MRTERDEHRPDLDETEWQRLIKQRRAEPERNPFLPPGPGEIDPLPPFLRQALPELRKLYALWTEEDRRWYIRQRCGHIATALANGESLTAEQQAWLVEALNNIAYRDKSPGQAIFGARRGRPRGPGKAEPLLIVKLMDLVWHDPQYRIPPKLANPGLRLITEGNPPWLAPSQAVAFAWVAELLGMNAERIERAWRQARSHPMR
jgi:hypothetical protein